MATIAPYGIYQAFDDNGDPLAGGLLYTYEAGTTTPKATYTTAEGDVENDNPVELDASGQANVWLGDGGYKFVLKDADGATIFTVDGIGGTSSSAFGAEVNAISVNTNINSLYANSVNICTGSPTLSLLAASTAEEGFYFSVKNEGLGVVTIDPDGAETIDGSSTKTIGPAQSALIITDGLEWFSLFFSEVTLSGSNAFTGANSFSSTSTFTGKVITPDDGELTIASGSITPTGVFHTVDTEAASATDDLDTISGGTDGQRLILRTEDSSRDVVLTNSGNIVTPGAFPFTLSSTSLPASMIYDGELSKWIVTAGGLIGGNILNIQSFTASGTYTKTIGTNKVLVLCFAGSGGGGAKDTNAGGAGGTSSFGSHCSATGGSGGQFGEQAVALLRRAADGVGSNGSLYNGVGLSGGSGVIYLLGGDTWDLSQDGGRGGLAIDYITSGIGTTETITIGAAGTAGAAGTLAGQAGQAGLIIVIELS